MSAPLTRWIAGVPLPRWRSVWVRTVLAIQVVALLGLAFALVRIAPRTQPVLTGPGRVAAIVLITGGVALGWAVVRGRRRGAALAAWGTFAGFYLVAAGALLPAADAFKSARPFCQQLAARVPAGEPVATYRFWRWRAEYSFYGDRTFEDLQTAEALRAWVRLPGRRWVLVEDWALSEARDVLGAIPAAVTGKVGKGTIVLLGPLH